MIHFVTVQLLVVSCLCKTLNPAPFFISLPTSKISDSSELRNTALYHTCE